MMQIKVLDGKRKKICQHGRILPLNKSCIFDEHDSDLCVCSYPIFVRSDYEKVEEV